jgi:hypothetical protein
LQVEEQQASNGAVTMEHVPVRAVPCRTDGGGGSGATDDSSAEPLLRLEIAQLKGKLDAAQEELEAERVELAHTRWCVSLWWSLGAVHTHTALSGQASLLFQPPAQRGLAVHISWHTRLVFTLFHPKKGRLYSKVGALEDRFREEALWVPQTEMYKRALQDTQHARGEWHAAIESRLAMEAAKETCLTELSQLKGEYENLRLTLTHSEVRHSF